MNNGVSVLSVSAVCSVLVVLFFRHRSNALFSAFESCLNRSVLIRVIRSNVPQIERESMAWASSGCWCSLQNSW